MLKLNRGTLYIGGLTIIQWLGAACAVFLAWGVIILLLLV